MRAGGIWKGGVVADYFRFQGIVEGYKGGQRRQRNRLLVDLVVVHAVLMFYLAKHEVIVKQKQLDVNVAIFSSDGRRRC